MTRLSRQYFKSPDLHAGETKVHGEDEKLLSVVGGVLENAAVRLVVAWAAESSAHRLGQKRRPDHRGGRVDHATRQSHSRLVHFLSTSKHLLRFQPDLKVK